MDSESIEATRARELQESLKAGAELMGFGKHKNQRVDTLPADYVEWIMQEALVDPSKNITEAKRLCKAYEKPARKCPGDTMLKVKDDEPMPFSQIRETPKHWNWCQKYGKKKLRLRVEELDAEWTEWKREHPTDKAKGQKAGRLSSKNSSADFGSKARNAKVIPNERAVLEEITNQRTRRRPQNRRTAPRTNYSMKNANVRGNDIKISGNLKTTRNPTTTGLSKTTGISKPTKSKTTRLVSNQPQGGEKAALSAQSNFMDSWLQSGAQIPKTDKNFDLESSSQNSRRSERLKTIR